MERDLVVAAHQSQDVLTLVLHGELDIATAADVRAALAQHRDGQASIVVDLHDLEFIDSSGLRLLLELNADQAGPGAVPKPIRPGRPAA